ncbi:MFS transporter [Streptomyces sp. NPDC003038]|uniref:MFS transporter n=1 Tax=unclassified Streptomyces TaxID=2593676 RepID=UPI0033B1C2D8
MPVGWLLLLVAPLGLGMTVPALLTADLAAGLAVPVRATTWLSTGFAWGVAVGTPLLAGLISRRGARVTVVVSAVLMLAGTVLLAIWPVLAPTVAGRALQGIGGGGLTAVAITLAVTPRRTGVLVSGIAAAGALGPTAGWLLVAVAPWRLVLMLTAVGLVAVPVVAGWSPATTRARTARAHTTRAGTTRARTTGVPATGAPATRPPRRRRPHAGFDAFDGFGAGLLAVLVTSLLCVPQAPVVAGAVLLVAGMLLVGWLQVRPGGRGPAPAVRCRTFPLVSALGLAFLLAAAQFTLPFAGAALTGGGPAPGVVLPLASGAVALLAAPVGRVLLTRFATGGPDDPQSSTGIRLFITCYQLGGAVGPALVAPLLL